MLLAELHYVCSLNPVALQFIDDVFSPVQLHEVV